jgi:hypothetical protein
MTGRVASVRDDRVTLGGVTYQFREGVRWVLEQSHKDGTEVEFVVVGGFVKEAMRVHRAEQ